MSELGLRLDFELTRPAKRGGGDRYEVKVKGLEKPMVIYVPQLISRDADNAPLGLMIVYISARPID